MTTRLHLGLGLLGVAWAVASLDRETPHVLTARQLRKALAAHPPNQALGLHVLAWWFNVDAWPLPEGIDLDTARARLEAHGRREVDDWRTARPTTPADLSNYRVEADG